MNASMKRRSLFRRFHDAASGLAQYWSWEGTSRLILLSAAGAVGMGIWTGLTPPEWLWVGLAIALVTVAELINTAVEAVVDLASPEIHPLARRAKDVAAAAVLISVVHAIFVAIMVFLIPWLRVIKR